MYLINTARGLFFFVPWLFSLQVVFLGREAPQTRVNFVAAVLWAIHQESESFLCICESPNSNLTAHETPIFCMMVAISEKKIANYQPTIL